jgi:SpoVK/Ycf46/Vps4 family AAA+-type ATPase
MKESGCQVIITIPDKYPHTISDRNVSGRSLYKKQKIPSRPTSFNPKAPPFELNNIKTLLKFAKSYQKDKFIIDHYKLRKIKKPLEKLNNIVGLNKLKEEIFNLVIYLLLYHEKGDLLHTVLQGPPGVGKTKVAEIMAELYSGLGYLEKGHIVKVKRNDLIGPFLGQTTDRTSQILEKAKGGVLFIDEAYQLGNSSDKDTYSKECLDALNQALTENKDEFICIIAGYEEALKDSFFSRNEGLERRFPYKFTLEKYTNKELKNIFSLMCKEKKWTHENFELPETLKFKENGGDMEKMFHFAKINHTRRVINQGNFKKKHLLQEDIQKTFDFFKDKEDDNDNSNEAMYL